MKHKTINHCKIGLIVADVILIVVICFLWTTPYYLWNILIGLTMFVANISIPFMLDAERMIADIKQPPSTFLNTYRNTLLRNRIPRNGGRYQRLS